MINIAVDSAKTIRKGHFSHLHDPIHRVLGETMKMVNLMEFVLVVAFTFRGGSTKITPIRINTVMSIASQHRTSSQPVILSSIPATLAPSPTLHSSITPTTFHTPTPTPTPELDFNVASDNRTCIMFEAALINITVNYTIASNSSSNSKPNKVSFVVSGNNTVLNNRSHCTEKGRDASLILTWHNKSDTEQNIEFHFTRQTNQWKLGLLVLNLSINNEDFPDINNTNKSELNCVYDKVVFLNEYQRSYKCDKSQTFNKLSCKKNSDKTLTINEVTMELVSQWQIQAFEFRRNGEFGDARMCPQSVAKDIKLPAIVGGVLFLLLTAVIAAYIFSRIRRRRAKLISYEALN